MGGAVKKVVKQVTNFAEDAMIGLPVAATKGAINLTKGVLKETGLVPDVDTSSDTATGSTIYAADSYSGEDEESEDRVDLGSGRTSKKRGRSTARKGLMAAQTSSGNSGGSTGLKV